MKLRTFAFVIFLVLEVTVTYGQSKPPIDSEARTVAKQLWDNILVKCGDSSFYREDKIHFLQLKGVSFDVAGEALTAADRANGIQWKGGAYVGSQLQRTYEPHPPIWTDAQPGWGKWIGGASTSSTKKGVTTRNGPWTPAPPDFIQMTKTNGSWTFAAYSYVALATYDPNSDDHKLSCSDVLKISSN